MKKLKIAYFGTPYFSARFLEKLLTDISIYRYIDIKFVVTRRDQPVGRKKILTKSPVKVVAEKYGTEIFDFDTGKISHSAKATRDTENLKLKIKQVDLALLYAYGGKLPNEIINLPLHGFWNIHPSLLPKYRGALPIVMPLMLGDQITGVTLIKLDEKVDHGPIIAQEKLAIEASDKKPDLEIKLTDLALEMFKEKIDELASSRVNDLKLTPQNQEDSTFTYQLKKEDGYVSFSALKKALNNKEIAFTEVPKLIFNYLSKYNLTENYKLKIKNSSKIIYDYFRGLYPWPGLWTLIKVNEVEKRLKITEVELKTNQLSSQLTNQLVITKVQLEGKKEVDFKTFNSAYFVF